MANVHGYRKSTQTANNLQVLPSSLLVTPVHQNNAPIFVGSEIDTITAPAKINGRKVLKGKLHHNARKLGHKVIGDRRKLFGQRTSYYR